MSLGLGIDHILDTSGRPKNFSPFISYNINRIVGESNSRRSKLEILTK